MYLALDIETFPIADCEFINEQIEKATADPPAYATFKEETRKAKLEEWKEKQIASVFDKQQLSPLTAQVAVLGMVIAHDGNKGLEYLQWDIAHNTEQQILQQAERYIIRYASSDIYTWNGRGFDLPFMLCRSMIQGIQDEILISAYSKAIYRSTDVMALFKNMQWISADSMIYAITGEHPKHPLKLWNMDTASEMTANEYIEHLVRHNREDLKIMTQIIRGGE